jgi:hypothetical protein
MAARKFRDDDRVIGREEGPASFRNRAGTVVDFKGRAGYGVRFDDTGITEYVDSDWFSLVAVGV